MKALKFILQFTIIFILLTDVVLSVPKWYYTKKGKRYLIEPEYKYNWFEASRQCARRNLHLVALDNKKKNMALIKILKKVFGRSRNFWLGCNDEFIHTTDKNRPFYWTSTGAKFSYSFWYKDRPNNPEEHCAHIWEKSEKFQWDDNVCDDRKYGFICEEKVFLEPNCKKIVGDIVNSPCSQKIDYILTGIL